MGYTPDVSMFPYFGNHRDIGELEDDLDKEMLRNEKLIERINAKIMERKKLENRLQRFKETNWKRKDDLVEALSPWKKNHQDHKTILEAIQELKEENKKLKDQNDYLWEPVNADDYIRLARQYDELKEKYEKTNLDKIDAWATIRGLKTILDNKTKHVDEVFQKYLKMKEENKKLKESL